MSKLDYRAAGVDIDAGGELVKRIQPHLQQTLHEHVLAGAGGFGAVVGLPPDYREPVLVSGTDGVGTKLLLARNCNEYHGIGIDLVAMCVNDILVQGARPWFFLDYYACGRLNVDQAEAVIAGIAGGCRQAGCALVGGETAEMPGMYQNDDFDLAGFAVGICERDKVITGTSIQSGDVVIGIASSGPHSNGYALIRRIIELAGADIREPLAALRQPDRSLGQVLLTPTRIYVPEILPLLETGMIRGMAHITGGGLTENIVRVLPEQLGVELDPGRWEVPPVFQWLQQAGDLDDAEMRRTFNCGIGFAVIAAEQDAEACLRQLPQDARIIGRIFRAGGSERVRYLPA